MDGKTRYLMHLYIGITLVFASIVVFNQRGHQDTWILEGIFLPTAIYALTFTIISVMVADNRILTIICAAFIIALNAIPNLKYQFFYGTFDSVGHFGFAKRLIEQGHVPETGFYSNVYSDFPGMHLFISSVSLISGLDVNSSIKFITSIIFGIFPFFIYLITNRVFDKKVQKYIILASSYPVVTSYILTGTMFGISLFFPFSMLFFILDTSKQHKRKYLFMLIIFAFSLLFSHAVTTISTIIFILFSFIFLRSANFIKKSLPHNNLDRKYIYVFILLSILFSAWLMFKADFVGEALVKDFKEILVGEKRGALIPERFFALPLLERIKFFTIKYIKDVIALMLSIVGLYVLLKKFKPKDGYTFQRLYIPMMYLLGAILLVIVLQFAIKYGEIEYRRFIDYGMLFTPFFMGLFFWEVEKLSKRLIKLKSLNKFTTSLILFSCISIAMIQTFPCQPLVPKANVLSSNLPENEYIIDLNLVNTIYQYRMIQFAERFSSQRVKIASDEVTRWQIYGFADENFSSRHTWYNPLESDKFTGNKRWDVLLLHYDGRSGPLNEKVEYRTRNALDMLRNALINNIYDNGESFILAKTGI